MATGFSYGSVCDASAAALALLPAGIGSFVLWVGRWRLRQKHVLRHRPGVSEQPLDLVDAALSLDGRRDRLRNIG